MFAVLACSAYTPDDPDIWDTSYMPDVSNFCFWVELKADEHISFL